MIDEMLNKPSKKCTLLQLQKLCGVFNFIARAIIPGRAFTRCLYAFMSSKTSNKPLKPHHHIRINAEMRKDVETWKVFLHHPSAFCRPFLDFAMTWCADEIDFYTDASGKIGFGGNLQRKLDVWNLEQKLSHKSQTKYRIPGAICFNSGNCRLDWQLC